MFSSKRSDVAITLLPALLALLSTAGYVLWASAGGLSGFPLDDAWIHQTYARNLAETGQLAYLPGQPSAGSTSPSWSFLLSVSYLVGLDFRVWAYLLGGLSLAATAWLAYRLFLRLPALRPGSKWSSRRVAALLTGLLCAVEWHLVWAAASGMETMLFTALSLALLEAYFSQIAIRQAPQGPASLRTEQKVVSAVGLGLLGGVLVLTRPEGLGLMGLVVVALLVFPQPPSKSEVKSRLLTTGVSLLAFGAMLAPYILFNLSSSGSIFPNTLYAKQTEYQIRMSLPARLWTVLSPTLVGAQVLLVPGFGFAIYRLIRDGRTRRERWAALVPVAWWAAFLIAYALRLPVNYQHGRYTMPTIPLIVLYGVWGTAALLRPHAPKPWLRVLSRATPLAVALLALTFWGRGATQYRDDVGFIEGEMIAIARWLNEHTAPDDLIAVHDIGAVGYLTDRSLLDLAGLITPEVIPFMTDAEQLTAWMIDLGADYAVFFPDFSATYDQLAADPTFQQVFCNDYAWTQLMNHQNMCVYRLSTEKRP